MKLNETTTPHNREMLERLDYHTDMDPELFIDCADIDYHIWLLANGSIEALEKYGVSAGDLEHWPALKTETKWLWHIIRSRSGSSW